MPSVAPAVPTIDLPPYVLLEVFEYLPGQDLVVASHTCRLWNQLILARRRLRTNAFIPSSYTPKVAIKDIELHPVFSQLHFDSAVEPEAAEYGVHKAVRKIMEEPVQKQLATSPAVTELRLDVMKYHPHVVVQNPEGVKVMDVVQELAKYKTAAAGFTFEDFYGREICSQRGYERKQRMRRVDMVGKEKVVVSFAPAVPFDGVAMFQALRFRSLDAARNAPSCKKENKEGHRFWSAFAFES